MGNDRYLAPENEFERYSIFMQDSGFRDVMDFVFWDGEEAFAGLGIMKSPDDPPITSEDLRVGWAMQPYLDVCLVKPGLTWLKFPAFSQLADGLAG